MRKIILILAIIAALQAVHITFKEIKNSDTGRFENSANSFKNFESASLSDLNGSDISSSYFDSKKAKLCIKNTYAHLSPYINQRVINKSTGKYLSGYNYNTFAIADGLGNLNEKSFALYGYKNIHGISECKDNAEIFLINNEIQCVALKKTHYFLGVYYFTYENSDGGIVTVGVDSEFCEIKFLNQ